VYRVSDAQYWFASVFTVVVLLPVVFVFVGLVFIFHYYFFIRVRTSCMYSTRTIDVDRMVLYSEFTVEYRSSSRSVQNRAVVSVWRSK